MTSRIIEVAYKYAYKIAYGYPGYTLVKAKEIFKTHYNLVYEQYVTIVKSKELNNDSLKQVLTTTGYLRAYYALQFKFLRNTEFVLKDMLERLQGEITITPEICDSYIDLINKKYSEFENELKTLPKYMDGKVNTLKDKIFVFKNLVLGQVKVAKLMSIYGPGAEVSGDEIIRRMLDGKEK